MSTYGLELLFREIKFQAKSFFGHNVLNIYSIANASTCVCNWSKADLINFKKPAFEPLTAFRVDVESRHAGLVIPRTAGPVGELQNDDLWC